MTTIVTRAGKGTPLTNAEVDANFSNLNDFKVEQTAATGAAQLPSGSTAQRPGTPAAGYIRYNATTGKFEGYGSAWGNIGGGAFIGDTAPANPGAGDLWWNSATGHTFVFYGSAWVDLFGGAEGQYLPLTGGTISGNLAYTGTLTGGTGVINIGSGQLYKDAAGNVGIGTSSPAQKLSLSASSANVAIRMSSVGGAGRDFDFVSNTSGGLVIKSDLQSNIATFDGILGNLGLGVTPVNKLDVLGSGSYSAAVDMTTAQLRLKHSTFPVQLYAGLDHVNRFAYMQASETGVGYRDLLLQPAGGNLLVGTTSGSYKLVVSAGDSDGMQVSCNGQRVTMRINQSNASYNNITRTGNSQDKWWDWNVATGATPTLAIYNSNSTGVQITWGATSWSTYSDERLKTDLIPIENATQKVSTLRTVTGRFKTDEESVSRSFIIAQDVLAVLPEAVDDEDPEKLGVRYTEVIPLLVAAIKELTVRLEALEAH